MLLEELNKCSGKLLVAVSGGVDSVVLLDGLHKLKFEIGIAHINHNLRADSVKDQQFVEKLSLKYDCPFFTIDLENPPNVNIEAWGRAHRYEFFEKITSEHGYDSIVTAHHLQDNIETYLMKLITAKELKGISGNKNVVRPLINVKKSEIISYAKEQKLEWVEDQSNSNPKFLRNRIRNEILPNLENVVPNIEDILVSQIVVAEEINSYFDSLLITKLSELSDLEFGSREWYRLIRKILEFESKEIGIRLLQQVMIPQINYRISRRQAENLRDFFILERHAIELSGNFTIKRYKSGILLLKK